MRVLRLRRRTIAVAAVTALLLGGSAVAWSATVPNPDPCDSRYRNSFFGERNYLDCRFDRLEVGLGKTVPAPDPCDPQYASSYRGLRNYADCRLDRVEQAILTVPPPSPTRVNVVQFGAQVAPADSSAQIQAALNSGASVVTLGETGVYRASVTIPANVTLESDGATMTAVGGAAVATTGGNHAVIRNVAIDTSTVAGHHTVRLQHSDTKASNVTITGDGFRYGVLIERQGQRLFNVTVEDSHITGTSYGILRQITDLESARITGNTFRNIRRGDAIELNVGNDSDVQVTGNDVDGVFMDGTGYGGIGIGIAGSGEYGEPLLGHNYLVSGNTVKNSESENIHFEKVRDSTVTGNTVEQTGAQSGVGIVHYGCTGMTVTGNTINNVAIGQWEGWGVINSTYIEPPAGGPNTWSNTVTNVNTVYLHTP